MARIEYKLSVIYQSFSLGLSSTYLSDLLSVIYQSFSLGLSSTYLSDLLSVYTPNKTYAFLPTIEFYVSHKHRTKTFGHRSFSIAAPTIWNYFPADLRHTDLIPNFSQHKKLILLPISINDKLNLVNLDVNH